MLEITVMPITPIKHEKLIRFEHIIAFVLIRLMGRDIDCGGGLLHRILAFKLILMGKREKKMLLLFCGDLQSQPFSKKFLCLQEKNTVLSEKKAQGVGTFFEVDLPCFASPHRPFFFH